MGGLEFKQKILALVCCWIIPPIYRRGDYFMPANKKKKVQQPLLKSVSSEEIFDQALELEEPGRINGSRNQFPARA